MFNPSPTLLGKTRALWQQAWPIILSNCTIPLVGLTDTAVLGHLSDARYLAAVALGAVVFSFLYWGFGFLRMGTTGLAAQAWGRRDSAALGQLILQALTLALVLGVLLQALRPLLPWMTQLLGGSDTIRPLAAEYLALRLWSAPAVLMQYVVLGVAIALARSRVVLALLILGNGINIALDLWFVLGLGMTSQGVALASLIAEWVTALVGLTWLIRTCRCLNIPLKQPLFERLSLTRLLRVNSHLFVRTLLLLFALAFFARQGALLGDEVLAANTLLMQLVMLASYLLDGFAQAVEGQFGAAFARNREEGLAVFFAGFYLSAITALLLTGLFWLAGPWMIQRLTDLSEVRLLATTYLPWLWVILPVSMFSYWLDGVCIGATWTDAMRNTLILSVTGFLLTWWLLQDWGNTGLWAAFLCLNSLRGLSLGWIVTQRLGLKRMGQSRG